MTATTNGLARGVRSAETSPGPGRDTHLIRPDIQGLRAVAVLLVIGSHAHIPGFGGGYAGVDVFFVISGFVITRQVTHERGRHLLVSFYSRRARRIVPAASATLIGTLLAARVFLRSHFDPALIGDVRWSSLFGANERLISTGSDYFVPGTAPSLITQFWSLAVEEQFYLVFPLLVVVSRLGRNSRRSLTFTLVPLVMLSAWWSAHTSTAEPTVAYYSPFTRFWELGVGCLLALAISRFGPPAEGWERAAAVLGVGGLILVMTVLPGASDYPGTLAWLPVSSAVVLLAAGARLRPLTARPLTWIGDRSYSLYLWHWVWLMLPAQLADPHDGPLWRIIELVGTFVTAELAYRFLETPLRRSRRLRLDPIAAGLLFMVCVVGVWTASLLVARFTAAG